MAQHVAVEAMYLEETVKCCQILVHLCSECCEKLKERLARRSEWLFGGLDWNQFPIPKLRVSI